MDWKIFGHQKEEKKASAVQYFGVLEKGVALIYDLLKEGGAVFQKKSEKLIHNIVGPKKNAV